MAEISTGKKLPSVDMTPMVDLGFLLITFFMLATSFSSQKVIKMTSPAGDRDNPDANLKCSKSITLMLEAPNRIKYYTCPESGKVDSMAYSSKALRQLIVNRQNEVAAEWGSAVKLFILLKSKPDAPYKLMVDAIDEMQITQAQFTICPIDEQDSTVFKIK